MTRLADQHCSPRSDALAAAQVQSLLAEVAGWRVVDGALERTFGFGNWLETLAFVDALGWICHVEDHHPDLAVSYDRCSVRFSTHSAHGLTVNDFVCAAKADALVARA